MLLKVSSAYVLYLVLRALRTSDAAFLLYSLPATEMTITKPELQLLS